MWVHVRDTEYFTIVSISGKHNHLFRAISLKSNTFSAERESVRSVKENMSVLYIIHF